MEKKFLIIEFAVGYMLKVLKSGVKTTEYKTEFSAIRHGNYFEFINLVKGELPFMVTYREGDVYIDDQNNPDDVDFAGLIKAGNSLKIFYENCIEFYGEIRDADISDLAYCKLASFEISLRMHANNHHLTDRNAELQKVIDAVGKHFKLSTNEIEHLQGGRRFLNMVKHFKQQFNTWEEGINALQLALTVLSDHKLTII
ncbi:MAG: hypothetical protein JNK08_00390 [Sediminibacterium sp.]|nr:hypothetical protein [Sediminibacterium sp.]